MATDNGLRLKKQKFIDAYCRIGTITAAAEALGMSRQQHYDWLARDPDYLQAFRAAEQAVADSLEAEAIRRARDGVDKPVFQGGQQVGTIREFSDTLLIFLLKGHKPDKFKDRHQVTAEVTHHEVDDFAEAVRQLEAELASRSDSGSPLAENPPPAPDRT